jgi:hypothetical protein
MGHREVKLRYQAEKFGFSALQGSIHQLFFVGHFLVAPFIQDLLSHWVRSGFSFMWHCNVLDRFIMLEVLCLCANPGRQELPRKWILLVQSGSDRTSCGEARGGCTESTEWQTQSLGDSSPVPLTSCVSTRKLLHSSEPQGPS